MGSERARAIEARMKTLDKLETTKGYDFSVVRGVIKYEGVSDFSMKHAIVYRENYLEELKKYSGYYGYDKLLEKLEGIKNPIAFYDFMSKNELTEDLSYQSDQVLSQEEFNVFLQDLEIDVPDIQTTPEVMKNIVEAENKAFKYQAGKERR